jgi:hypothetical protein
MSEIPGAEITQNRVWGKKNWHINALDRETGASR